MICFGEWCSTDRVPVPVHGSAERWLNVAVSGSATLGFALSVLLGEEPPGIVHPTGTRRSAHVEVTRGQCLRRDAGCQARERGTGRVQRRGGRGGTLTPRRPVPPAAPAPGP